MTIDRFRKMLRIIEDQIVGGVDQKRVIHGIKALIPEDRTDLLAEIEEAKKRVQRRIREQSLPLGWRYPSK